MKTVNEIYNNVGSNIIRSIPEDWRKAVLNIEVLKGYTSYNGFYLNNNDEKKSLKVSKFSDNVNDDLLVLHKITTEGNNNKWNKAIFNVTPEGEFNMEFIWDQGFQDKIDQYNRQS